MGGGCELKLAFPSRLGTSLLRHSSCRGTLVRWIEIPLAVE
jgi:hypothetical protein